MNDFKKRKVLVTNDGRQSKAYDIIDDFINGYARVCINKKWTIINNDLDEMFEPQYDELFIANDYGFFKVVIDGKYGFIDKNGNEVLPIIYDYASNWCGGCSIIRLNNQYGFVCQETCQIIVEPKYDGMSYFFSTYHFGSGMAVIMLNNKYGLINQKGEEIVPPKKEEMSDLYEEKLGESFEEFIRNWCWCDSMK